LLRKELSEVNQLAAKKAAALSDCTLECAHSNSSSDVALATGPQKVKQPKNE
uniref:Homeodomain-containing transcription factor n=1 Tax=Echinostoma caproni TaxID=27848 RepID=A0A183B017_9TREM